MKGIMAYISLGLCLLLVVVVVGSWMVSVAMPGCGFRSMLSQEGIRWFIGHFADIQRSKTLVWLLLAAISSGAWRGSRLSGTLRRVFRHESVSYHERLGLRTSAVVLAIFIGLVGYLVLAPHAVLRGATGGLVPSPFFTGIIPIVCFTVLAVSSIYGLVSRTYKTIPHLFRALCHGIAQFAPVIVLYILATQLIHSIAFVLN